MSSCSTGEVAEGGERGGENGGEGEDGEDEDEEEEGGEEEHRKESGGFVWEWVSGQEEGLIERGRCR